MKSFNTKAPLELRVKQRDIESKINVLKRLTGEV